MVIQLVSQEMGASVIPVQCLSIPYDSITLRPIKDFDDVMGPSIIKLKDSHQSVAARQFWQLITKTSQQKISKGITPTLIFVFQNRIHLVSKIKSLRQLHQ